MKKIFLMVAAVALSGCAATQPRTGSIVVHKFAYDEMKTDNPFLVKKDSVDVLSNDLTAKLIEQIKSNSKMTISKDCSGADFELVGKFESINARVDSHWRFVTVTVNNLYEIDTDVKLKRCNTGELLDDWGPSKSGENVSDLIGDLAEYIGERVSREKVKPVQP